MKYSFCSYLISNKDEHGNILIYNTLFDTCVCINKSESSVFRDFARQIIEHGDYIGPVENLQQFLEQKIVVMQDDPSIGEVLTKRRDEVFQPKGELMLTLLPTHQCNFRCTYCYEEFKNEKMNEKVIDRICCFVDRFLNDYGSLHLCWFGGEPLLALDVIETLSKRISDICKKHKKPYYASMTTNGYLLDLNTFKKLLGLHVMQFQVTLDGDRETHNKQRALVGGQETYDVILNNLLNIKKHITTSTILITLRVNVSNEIDYNNIQKLIDEFSDDERFYINIQRIFSNGTNEETTDEQFFSVLKNCSLPRTEAISPQHSICYAAKTNTLMISATGDLGKCTVNFQDPNNCLGNILNYDLDSFSLDSIKYSNSTHLPKDCQNCCVYPLCFGEHCPARRQQLCEHIVQKYRAAIRNYTSKAVSISLK